MADKRVQRSLRLDDVVFVVMVSEMVESSVMVMIESDPISHVLISVRL